MATKSIKFNNGVLRLAPLAAALLCILAVFFVVRWCIADTLATQTQGVEFAEYAAQLSPSNPRAAYTAAFWRERTFLADDFQKALAGYERATALAPNDFRMWFDLGKARDRNGDSQGAEKAYRKAIELAPNYSRNHWALGNLLLREDRTDEAFAEIRRAVANDTTLANPAVGVAWNFFDGNVPVISQTIGDSTPIKAALLTFLASQQRFDEAFTLWNALSENDKRNTYKADSQTLLNYLLKEKKYRDALSVQTQIDPSEGERFEIGKIFNSGFEADVKMANAGPFEWSITDGLQPQVGFDGAQKHGGNRSLVIVFNSMSGQEFRAIQQNVAVESGKRYRFELFARSDIKSPATVKWEIVDTADGKLLGSTSAVPNSTDWTALGTDFTTAPTTQAVTIRLVRVPCPVSMCPISGKIWFDDFNLRKSE
jgi:hypothetical protein